MKLSVKALAITSGLVWGGAMLTCGLVNLAARPYGRLPGVDEFCISRVSQFANAR